MFIGPNLPGHWSPEVGVTRGDGGETEVMMRWRGNGPAPPGHLAFRGDLYWQHFSWIYLLLIDNEGHICKECVVIQSWSICVRLASGEQRTRPELFVNPAVNAE